MSKSKSGSNKNQAEQQQQQIEVQVVEGKRVATCISDKEFDAMTIGECEYEYDYETILEKILDEKKLNLARSPEVIRFLREFKHQTGASASHCGRIIL